jgi:hypothetical protein
MVDWVFMDSAKYDLRMTMLTCSVVGGKAVFAQKVTWGTCNIQQISPITGLPVCFTT